MSVMDWIGKLPTTQTRIAATILIAMGTAVKYWVSSAWEPSWEWLTFLCICAGIDAAQYYGKRLTYTPEK